MLKRGFSLPRCFPPFASVRRGVCPPWVLSAKVFVPRRLCLPGCFPAVVFVVVVFVRRDVCPYTSAYKQQSDLRYKISVHIPCQCPRTYPSTACKTSKQCDNTTSQRRVRSEKNPFSPQWTKSHDQFNHRPGMQNVVRDGVVTPISTHVLLGCSFKQGHKTNHY